MRAGARHRSEQVLNAAVTTETDGRYRAFADRIAAQLQAAGVPGGALAIVENGELVFATGMGVKKAGGEAAPVGIDPCPGGLDHQDPDHRGQS